MPSRFGDPINTALELRKGLKENEYFLNLRTSEIHLFYNLQLFYWHFLEFLWLFIFQVFYSSFGSSGATDVIIIHLSNVAQHNIELVS